jgi:hypothetical protein
MTSRFSNGSMPVENSSTKSSGVLTMKVLATCTRRRNPPLRSLHLAVGLGGESEAPHNVSGETLCCGRFNLMKTGKVSRLSRTLSRRSTVVSWMTEAMRRRTLSGRLSTSKPSTDAVPLVGRLSVVRILA